jgi:hypothetical protein
VPPTFSSCPLSFDTLPQAIQLSSYTIPELPTVIQWIGALGHDAHLNLLIDVMDVGNGR